MFSTVTAYFQSGRRICLVGLLALADARERFAQRITQYFIRWQDALANALTRAGKEPALAEEIVAAIQGALVLARATYDSEVFSRTIARLQARVEA